MLLVDHAVERCRENCRSNPSPSSPFPHTHTQTHRIHPHPTHPTHRILLSPSPLPRKHFSTVHKRNFFFFLKLTFKSAFFSFFFVIFSLFIFHFLIFLIFFILFIFFIFRSSIFHFSFFIIPLCQCFQISLYFASFLFDFGQQHLPTEEVKNAVPPQRRERKAAPRQRRGKKEHHPKKRETKQHHPSEDRKKQPHPTEEREKRSPIRCGEKGRGEGLCWVGGWKGKGREEGVANFGPFFFFVFSMSDIFPPNGIRGVLIYFLNLLNLFRLKFLKYLKSVFSCVFRKIF